MKTTKLYEIRKYKDSMSYSVPMSAKLRTRVRASRLVKKLRSLGHAAFIASVAVAK